MGCHVAGDVISFFTQTINTVIIIPYADINECTRNISGCEDTCENTEGSYFCVCNRGLVLAADNHNCTGELTQ